MAALNNREMLPWDVWGEMLRPGEEPDDAQTAFFDELAARYRSDPRLTVPATVFNAVLHRDDEV